jgi:hypothetical protein
MFSYEEDLLKLRIIEGLKYVEKFIIVEAKQTHTSFKKSLYSDKMKDFFETYKDRIIHCIVDKFPVKVENYPKGLVDDMLNFRRVPINNEGFNWLREGYQRSIIGHYASHANGSDIFIISDLDEIPNYEKLAYECSINKNNILNEQINYFLPTYVYNIHYKLETQHAAAFTCPAKLLNVNNINRMRFFTRKKCLDDGHFTHLNRFFKPKELIMKEKSIADSSGCIDGESNVESNDFKSNRKNILKQILTGNYNGRIMEYKSYDMPKNIDIISKFYLLNKEEIECYLKKIDDPILDFENTYNEIINL